MEGKVRLMNILNMMKKFRHTLYVIRNNIRYSSMDRKKTFDYIYAKGKWGKMNGEEFYSGGLS